MASDGTIKITTELDSSKAQSAMAKFDSVAKTGVHGVATAVTAVSAALTGAAGYAISTGITFESAFAGVKKTVNATDEEIASFREGIIEMSKRIPSSASAISEVAEAAGQLGIKNENILSFTEVMTNMGVATNMSATESATSLARLANITKMPQENFDRLGSTIVSLGNNLATTESEITETGLRLAGTGKQVGMSEAKIMGLAAALSSVGIEAEAGGSAVSTVLSKMQLAVESGGDSLNAFADVAGMTAEEFSNAFKTDAAGALTTFVTGLGTMDERGQSSIKTLDDMGITEIRQRDALLRLSGAGDLLSESIGIATNAWDENNALTNEAAQRYETLESNVTLLKNNVEGFGIAIYDNMRDPLKAAVDEGINGVDRLQDAFEHGGLQAAVEEAGSVFADVATDVANASPKMVGSAVKFIDSFCDGIYDNRKELTAAAGTVASTLAKGMADLLPKSVKEPAQDAVKEITKSFESGGLKKTVGVLGDTVENLGKITENVAKIAVPPLTKSIDLMGNNVDKLIPLLTTAYTAVKSYGTITKKVTALQETHAAAVVAVTNMEKANALQLVATNGGLTVQQTLIALHNGQITVTTALTGLWAKAQAGLNSTLVANPIGLVVTAVAALTAGMAAYVLITKDSTSDVGKLSEQEKKLAADVKEQKEAYDEVVESRNTALGSISAEYGNLQSLSEELQTLVDENGKVKEGYEDRANVITGLLSDALGTEITITDGVIDNYGELKQSIDNVIQSKKAEAVLNAMEESYTEAINGRVEALRNVQIYEKAVKDTQKQRDEAQQKLIDTEARYRDELSNTGSVSQETRDEFAKAKQELENYDDTLKTNKDTLSDAKDRYSNYITTIQNYEGVVGAVASGDAAQISEALKNATNSFITAENGTRESLENQVTNMKNNCDSLKLAVEEGMPGVTQSMVDEAQEMVDKSKAELDKFSDKARESTAKAGDSAVTGLSTKKELMSMEAKDMIDKADAVIKAKDLTPTGGAKISELTKGMELTKPKSDATAKTISDSVNANLGSADTGATGSSQGSVYASSLGKQSGYANSQGIYVASSANSGLGSIDGRDNGSNMGSTYCGGVNSKSGDSNAAGRNIASEANAGAGTGDGYGVGSNFGSGFVEGIGNWISSAWNAGVSIANSAYNAAKKWLDEHSPSKKTRKLGKWFGQGLELGIEDEEANVEKASESISQTAMDAINMDAISHKLRGINIEETMSRMYASVDDRNNAIADNIIVKVEALEKLDEKRKANEIKDLKLQGMDMREISGYVAEGIKNSGLAIMVDDTEVARLEEGVFKL